MLIIYLADGRLSERAFFIQGRTGSDDKKRERQINIVGTIALPEVDERQIGFGY